MSRCGWNDLPDEVRTAVQDSIGRVHSTFDVAEGQNNDLALRLDRAGQPPVFLKGVRGGGRRGMFLSNEVDAGRLAAGIAPAVLCHVEHEDWQVIGFEYISGRPADLSPGSADLDRVGRTLDKLSELPAIDIRPLRLRWSNPNHWRNVAERAPESVRGWDIDEMCRWSARTPELINGNCLLHTDLHSDQFRITNSGRVFVIDWSFPAAGAPWVDAAFLSLRLTASGHRHAEAQQWAYNRAGWAGLDRASRISRRLVCVCGGTLVVVRHTGQCGTRRRARLARNFARQHLRELTEARN